MRSDVIEWRPRDGGGLDAHRETKAGHKRVWVWVGMIRPARGAGGIFSGTHGWVVSGRSFDDLAYFDTLAQSKLHMEALEALNGY